jgi:hypothetical protein
MATAPEGRLVTIRFTKGSIRAPKANIEKLKNIAAGGWTSGLPAIPGTRRRKYGYRRRSNASAGQAIQVDFADGERWTYRLTGTVENFISRIIATGTNDPVTQVTTQRGAEYGPDNFQTIAP